MHIMANPTNEIVLINATWNAAVGAYIAKIDGKTAIITLADSTKSATVKAAPAEQVTSVKKPGSRRGKSTKKSTGKTKAPAAEVEADATKSAKSKTDKAKRMRSPSLSAAQEAEVLALSAAGKSLSEILAAIPGSTVGIVRRLKRVAAAKPVEKAPKAKAKPATKAAAKKTATKNTKAAPAA